MSLLIRNLFSDIAPTYDRANHLLSLNADKSWRRKAVETLPFEPSLPIRVLDLCAGTADFSLAILQRYRSAHISAVDFSLPMLQLGKAKTKNRSVQFLCADALQLPFSEGSFDVVLCGYGFRNLDDKEAALREIRRVLNRDGYCLILDFFRPVSPASRLFHATYGKWILPFVGGLISKNRGAYEYLGRSIGSFYSLNECECAFIKHGLKSFYKKDYFKGVSSLMAGQKI